MTMHGRRCRECIVWRAFALGIVAVAPASASDDETPPAHTSRWRDPGDGQFDLSNWLLGNHGGFLPVPIVITDPAIGHGGGVALAFFQHRDGESDTRLDERGRPRLIEPNLYGVAAMRTSNGTEGFGAGASMHFAEDRWRWRGALGKASVNLAFHTAARELDYNADGRLSYQQVLRRFGRRDLFVGLAWIYMDVDIAFENPLDAEGFLPHELASRSSGLGLSLEYDTRDNPFTASRGGLVVAEYNAYEEALGSDHDFRTYRAHAYRWLPFGERFVLGLRADWRGAGGRVPFYRLPFIDLRGIGAARYQDTRAAVLEGELRWNFTPRWALIGFAGAGRTWGRRDDFGGAPDRTARGAGVRYLLARKLGLYAGLDYAWGPEDETFYVQVGSAWR